MHAQLLRLFDSAIPAFMDRVALLACVGGLAFVVCEFGGFLP